MRLVIDTREPNAIIQYLNAVNNNHIQDNKSKKNKSATISIEVKPLDIGDYEIYYLDDDLIPSVIIERKSLADLESSIKDGRYKEQSFRLDKSAIHNHNIIYLIEGNIQNYRNSNFRQTIYSTMFSLNYFKGFSVICSNNQIETGEIVYNFIQKLGKESGKQGFYQNVTTTIEEEQEKQEKQEQEKDKSQEKEKQEEQLEQSNDYLACVKTSKKSFITTENIFELMLMQIPGISNVSANAISGKYANMDNLLQSLKNETCKEEFSMIRLSNGRKLNKNIVESIQKYLLIE